MKKAGWILGVCFLTILSGLVSRTFGQDSSKKSAWLATVRPDRLEIHTEPSPTSHIMGYVNRGTGVSVDLETTVSGEAWCEITVAGYNVPAGYVPCDTLEHEQHAGPSNGSPSASPLPASPEKNVASPAATRPLANGDILDMLKMGLSAEIVTAKIKGSLCTFDTSPPALQELKSANAPDSVILAMVQAPVSPRGSLPGDGAHPSALTPTQAKPANEAAAQVPSAPVAPAARATPLVLEDGTPVKLRISQTVSSADAHVNDRVDFEVLEELRVGGLLVIPKGGLALGTVTEAQAKRRMARGGKLNMNIDSVRLVTGEKAALRAVKEAKGGGHTGAMTAGIVATGLIVWPAAPFFLFMHGKDITIPKGTEITAFINGNLPLDAAKLQDAVSPTAASAPAAVAAPPPNQALAGAELEISSVPDGAEVQIDGKFVGTTPSTVGVPPGDHTVSIKRAGFKEWQRTIRTSTGKAKIAADLEPDAKTL